ncbi:MAG: glycosyltransferase [Thermoprotei archaeon]
MKCNLGLVTNSLMALVPSGGEYHINQVVDRLKKEYDLAYFPTAYALLQAQSPEDFNKLKGIADRLEKGGIKVAQAALDFLEKGEPITERDWKKSRVTLQLFYDLAGRYRDQASSLEFLYAPNFITPEVALMGKPYGVLIQGYFDPLYVNPLSYAIKRVKMGERSFPSALVSSAGVWLYWRRVVGLLKKNRPEFVASVNSVGISPPLRGLARETRALKFGFAVDLASLPPPHEKKDYLVYIGRLVPEKGLYELPKVVSILKAERREVELRVAGNLSEKFRAKFQKALEARGVVGNVKLLGYINGKEKWDLLSGAKALIYPSHNDLNALSILEAVAAGTPAVTYDLPGIRNRYSTVSAVIRVKEFDVVGMAKEAGRFLDMSSQEIKEFMNREGVKALLSSHGSWSTVYAEEVSLIEAYVKRHGCAQ